MYLEIDDDETLGITALSLVHNVTFTCKNPSYGSFKLNYVSGYG